MKTYRGGFMLIITLILGACWQAAGADRDGRLSAFDLAVFAGRDLPALGSDRRFPFIRLYWADFPVVGNPEGARAPAAIALEDKLDANLVDVIRAYEAGGIDGVRAYGVEHQMDIPDGRVEVIVNAVSMDALGALRDEVLRRGGSVQTEFENTLYATLPVGDLEDFVMQEAVWRVDWSRQVFAPPRDAVTVPSSPR